MALQSHPRSELFTLFGQNRHFQVLLPVSLEGIWLSNAVDDLITPLNGYINTLGCDYIQTITLRW
jgi:hypothetical protein